MLRTFFEYFHGTQVRNSFLAQLQPWKRRSWKPKVREGESPDDASKFGGLPWLHPQKSWPHCQHCGKPMPLFLQLNFTQLPDALQQEYGTGLLQLFYCTSSDPHCESECNAFFPFTSGKLVRIVQAVGTGQTVEVPDAAQLVPPQQIISWEACDDYPGWEEGSANGISLSDDEWECLAEQDFPRSGDKLAGWPHWVQGVEYPHCHICQAPMRLIFQLDSNDHLPYQFGDLGVGHLTQCPTHQNEVAFAWACS